MPAQSPLAVAHHEPSAQPLRDPLPRILADVVPNGNDPQAVEEMARYVAQMAGELAAMARATRLELLAYFLEMARIEATTRSRRNGDAERA